MKELIDTTTRDICKVPVTKSRTRALLKEFAEKIVESLDTSWGDYTQEELEAWKESFKPM